MNSSDKNSDSEEFSIQFVARVTGMNPHTIRAWEKRYQSISPSRDQNGRRLYQHKDIKRLKMLSELVNMGNKISDLSKLPHDVLLKMYHEFIGEEVKNTKKHEGKVDLHSTLQNMIMALSAYKLDVISHELNKIKDRLSLRDFGLGLIAPLMSEVGQQVEHGYLGIAQEHALSAIVKFHIGQVLYQNLTSEKKLTKKMAIASPEGQRHEFGLLISALLCCHYHLQFYYLGADLPAMSLIDALKALECDVLILGMTGMQSLQSQTFAKEYLEKLMTLSNKNLKIWPGGASPLFKDLESDQISPMVTLQQLDLQLSRL